MKIKFIGDLSISDVDLLVQYAKNSKNILEFGVGGSTQILSQCLPTKLISIDTDNAWIDITKSRIENKIENKIVPEFYLYSEGLEAIKNLKFDMIFVDGVPNLRSEFAVKTWNLLEIGGHMLIHDTRVQHNQEYGINVLHQYFNEVESIFVNQKNQNGKTSNMTVIKKKIDEPYVNWNNEENKPMWAYGAQMDPALDLWEHISN